MATKKKRRLIPIDELAGGPLVESATEGTALACALIASTYVENALGSLLTKVLLPGDVSDRLLNDPLAILRMRRKLLSFAINSLTATSRLISPIQTSNASVMH